MVKVHITAAVAVSTATAVWEETVQYIDDKAKAVVKDIAKSWEEARDRTLKKTTGVYEIFVNPRGYGKLYNNYFFGGFKFDIQIPNQTEGSPTYKYGTTTQGSINSRYPPSSKGRTGYIGRNLRLGNMGHSFFYGIPTSINPRNFNASEANALEKQLLLAYCLSHYCYHPPGNTKFG